MKKTIFCITISILGFGVSHLQAQNESVSSTKLPIYAELGFGLGQTLFFGDMSAKLQDSYGGSFSPGLGYNLISAFYYSPEKWKGFGLGSRIKGTFGSSVKGDFGDSYIFNYYNIAIAAKYHFVSKQFNKGLYGRASVGFGQLTTKRVNQSINLYKHQYAIGSVFIAGLGYAFPFKKTALGIEAEFEFANRNGTIDGKGDAIYQSGQIGVNVIFSF